MKDKRRAKLEAELAAAEGEFRMRLLSALRATAAGHWGVFGQNEHLDLPNTLDAAGYEKSGARDLTALGSEIDAFRDRLGIAERFPLYARFLELRGRQSANQVGEARLAQSWLKELGE